MAFREQLLEQAQTLHQQGNFGQAEAIYLYLLNRNPGDTNSLHLLGLLHADTKRSATGIQLIRTAIGIEGPRPWLCRNLGILLEREGNRAGAIACYRQSLDARPDDFELWAALAGLLADEGRSGEAAAAWRRVLEGSPRNDPNEANCRLKLGNALALSGDRRSAIVQFDRVLALDPQCVEAAFHQGVAQMQSDDAPAAALSFQKALDLDPNHAKAANNLGILRQLDRNYAEAIPLYQRAVRSDSRYHAALYNLGTAWQESGVPGKAIPVLRKLLKLDPTHSAAWTNLGNAWLAFNRTGEALAAYRESLRLTPNEPAAEWNIGIVNLLEGKLESGWAGYERRFDVKGATPRRPFVAPLWRGEPLAGKTILLHAEQGLGDTLQFIRYASELSAFGARVFVECQQPLISLLRGSIEAQGWDSSAERLPATDFQIPMLSAPAAIGTALDTIPRPEGYLRAPQSGVERWAERLGPKNAILRAGIAWAGNPNHKNDRNRSIPPELLSELTLVPGIEWISLQKGHRPPEAVHLLDAARELTDFADTAGLIENLDLVISVDTSVAHLAGALGKPVWILLPFAPDWRWMLNRTSSPWYSSARLFRQPSPGDWKSGLNAVCAALRECGATLGGPRFA